MRLIYTLFALGLICLLGGARSREVTRIPGATPFTPPPSYRAAYDSAVACTGAEAPRPYTAIVWYDVPGREFTDPLAPLETGRNGHRYRLPMDGETVFPDTIYIAHDWRGSWVPKHEMIHYLRQDPTHPVAVFGDACHAMWGYLR